MRIQLGGEIFKFSIAPCFCTCIYNINVYQLNPPHHQATKKKLLMSCYIPRRKQEESARNVYLLHKNVRQPPFLSLAIGILFTQPEHLNIPARRFVTILLCKLIYGQQYLWAINELTSSRPAFAYTISLFFKVEKYSMLLSIRPLQFKSSYVFIFLSRKNCEIWP